MNNTDDIRKQLNRRVAELNEAFDRQRDVYKNIQEYIAPWSGVGLASEFDSDELIDGDRKDLSILDPTATYALEVLAAGMQSGLTSPARPWFRLGMADEGLREVPSVKQWLYQVENGMRYVFSRANTYRALHHSYKELGAFGTAAMALFFNYNTVVRCRPFTCGEYRIALNSELRTDTFLYHTFMTARQLVEKFSEDKVSQSVKEAFKNGKAEGTYKVYWLVEPNDDRIKAKDFLGRPFRSIWFEAASSEDKLLEVSGYNSFPCMVPRWFAVSGKSYGAGPGHSVIGHVKMLQKMQEKGLIALDKQVDPPLVGPTSLKQGQVNTMPGGVTSVDEMGSSHGFRALHEVRADLNALEMKIQSVQMQIRTGMFNDLFLMLANQPLKSGITATEIAERHEEKLIMLGPVLESLHSELLDPLIDRTFEIMLENGLVPEPPQQIQGADLRVEYISILAQAQKMVGTSAINQFAQFVGGMASMNPEVLDKVNFDEAIDIYGDMTGVPPSMIVPDDVVASKRQARQQQMKAQQTAAMLQPTAEAIKAVSETKLDDNSALDALLGRTGGLNQGRRR